MLQITGLSKGYANQPLFENISFTVNTCEKAGLVGRNGYGKTTLLRIISGEETPDEGTVSFPRDYSIGYLKQNIDFEHATVLEECASNLPEENIHDIWRVEKILSGLGFDPEDLQNSPYQLSGGFQVRLNLAKLLVSEPKMLLLDEPTNYLDILSIRWLKKFLREWKGELILITHDREFMDDVVTHVIAIHRGMIRKMKGNTEKMYLQMAQDEEIYEKTRINNEKERQRIEQFVSRFRSKARLAGMAQSRMKMLKKMKKQDHLVEIKDLEFSFNYQDYPGKWAVETENLSFGYEKDKLLIDNLNLLVNHTDRIGIIGKNGKGKSTLIRLIAEELEPVKGMIKSHPKLKTGYFGQTNRELLTPHLTIEEEIQKSLVDTSRERARSIAGSMLFEGDMSQKKISVLSGGEKARVLLGKIVASPCQLLLLDEPTNHLDMQASDALLEAIDAYEGAVVMVTHNEMFLHSLANRLVIFDNNRVFIYEGSYGDFLSEIGWSSEGIVQSESKKDGIPVNKKEIRRIKAEINEEKNRILNPIKKDIENTENEITESETNQQNDNNALIQAIADGNNGAIAVLGKAIKERTDEIENLYDRLDELTNRFETLTEEYKNKLSGLN